MAPECGRAVVRVISSTCSGHDFQISVLVAHDTIIFHPKPRDFLFLLRTKVLKLSGLIFKRGGWGGISHYRGPANGGAGSQRKLVSQQLNLKVKRTS